MKLLLLGDQAVLAYLPDEPAALRFAAAVRRAPPPWVVDVVQAYTSVAVFYDFDRTEFQGAAEHLQQLALTPAEEIANGGRLHRIPCCYELHLDLDRTAAATGLAVEEVIRRHSGTEYTVYAIGFCPGFPYLGYLPPDLCGVSRLPKPRLRVEAGSVGLTGRQTGIYTEAGRLEHRRPHPAATGGCRRRLFPAADRRSRPLCPHRPGGVRPPAGPASGGRGKFGC
jgi:inhibitor of KinA